MKSLTFILTMPNVGSWNGVWTGKRDDYFVVRKYNSVKDQRYINATQKENYYYNFGDGWGMNIEVVKGARRGKSAGFCGYNWAIEEIEKFGRIRTSKERHDAKQVGEQ
jgi:hypothetical protein